ncbi:MAG: response regulator [Planctomycetaceae bacterium]
MAVQTVVVVDDDELDRYIFRRILKATGRDIKLVEYSAGDHFLDVVTDQERSSAELGQTPPSILVFLDINMPRMTGLEVLEAIEQKIADDQMVIVTMYSSSNHGQDREDAMQYSFVKDFVVKPLSQERFLELVDSVA